MSAPEAVSTATPSPVHLIHLVDDPDLTWTVSVTTAAKALGVSRSAAYRAVKAAREDDPSVWPTRLVMVGTRVRIPRMDLARVLGFDLRTASEIGGVVRPSSAAELPVDVVPLVIDISPPEVAGPTNGRTD